MKKITFAESDEYLETPQCPSATIHPVPVPVPEPPSPPRRPCQRPGHTCTPGPYMTSSSIASPETSNSDVSNDSLYRPVQRPRKRRAQPSPPLGDSNAPWRRNDFPTPVISPPPTPGISRAPTPCRSRTFSMSSRSRTVSMTSPPLSTASHSRVSSLTSLDFSRLNVNRTSDCVRDASRELVSDRYYDDVTQKGCIAPSQTMPPSRVPSESAYRRKRLSTPQNSDSDLIVSVYNEPIPRRLAPPDVKSETRKRPMWRRNYFGGEATDTPQQLSRSSFHAKTPEEMSSYLELVASLRRLQEDE